MGPRDQAGDRRCHGRRDTPFVSRNPELDTRTASVPIEPAASRVGPRSRTPEIVWPLRILRLTRLLCVESSRRQRPIE